MSACGVLLLAVAKASGSDIDACLALPVDAERPEYRASVQPLYMRSDPCRKNYPARAAAH